jgi:hypothetical protein
MSRILPVILGNFTADIVVLFGWYFIFGKRKKQPTT